MRVITTGSATLAALRPHCESKEAELNLMLGIAATTDALVAVLLEEGGDLSAVVVRTPPHGLVLAEWRAGAAMELAERMASAGMETDTPSVVGSTPAAESFARAFATATERPARLGMSQRILSLTEVIATQPTRGHFREAVTADVAQIGEWFIAFAREAEGREVERDAQIERARARVERGDMFVWEEGDRIVTMAGLTRPTWHGVAINAVYTPPALRGRGHASACVAGLSQHALDEGREFTCLYTDASNPTSNRIYERLGYREVCESEEWRFD